MSTVKTFAPVITVFDISNRLSNSLTDKELIGITEDLLLDGSLSRILITVSRLLRIWKSAMKSELDTPILLADFLTLSKQTQEKSRVKAKNSPADFGKSMKCYQILARFLF